MRDLVISVPHNGTRTLVDHLDLSGWKHFPCGGLFERYPQMQVRVHIPIRDPNAVVHSWLQRQGRDSLGRLLEAYGAMLEFVHTTARPHVLHRMEGFEGVRFGQGEASHVLVDAAQLADWRAAVWQEVVEPNGWFWGQFGYVKADPLPGPPRSS